MSSRDSKQGALRPYSHVVYHAHRFADAIAICLPRYVAVILYPEVWDNEDTIITVSSLLIFWLAAASNRLYRPWQSVGLGEHIRAAIWSWAMVVPPMLLVAFMLKITAEHSRLVNLGWFGATGVLLILLRLVNHYLLVQARKIGRYSRTTAVIGATRVGFRLCEHLNAPGSGMRLVGIYDDRNQERIAKYLGENGLAGNFQQAVADARAGKVDLIYIALPLRAEARIAELVTALADSTADVQMAADFSVFELLHARWGAVGEIPTVSLYDTPFQGVSGWAKRVEDVVLGCLILLLISPLMICIALAVKLTTKGPIFFRQTRYGLNGKPIGVLKFRSMTTADDGKIVKQATKGDKRITPIGGFLRKTSLDELPQFINVVLGHMSIVGPRPHAVAHNEQYRSLIHGYMLRHKVKPGITGWAQVNGCRGETDTVEKMRERVKYDLEYIENWRLTWDLQIILMTALKAWSDKSAY
jgi:putative colanic acid biosysnthesis UDP-glucose lipid carrier transferase